MRLRIQLYTVDVVWLCGRVFATIYGPLYVNKVIWMHAWAFSPCAPAPANCVPSLFHSIFHFAFAFVRRRAAPFCRCRQPTKYKTFHLNKMSWLWIMLLNMSKYVWKCLHAKLSDTRREKSNSRREWWRMSDKSERGEEEAGRKRCAKCA